MNYILLIISIMIWPFGQLLNLRFGEFAVYPLDIVCFLLFLSLFLSRRVHKKITSDPLFKAIIIFLGVALLSLVINIDRLFNDWSYPLFYLGRLIVYPSVYFATKLYPIKRVLPYILLSLIVFLLLGLAQYLFLPDMRFLKYLGFDDHYYRLTGSLFDPNFIGALLTGVILYFMATGKYLHTLPLLFLLGVTFSRASYLAFFVGFVYLLLNNKNWKLLIYLGLLGLIVTFIPKPFGEGVNLLRTFSIFSRFESWEAGIKLFTQKPLFGWGYNTLRSITGERFQIDNSFIFIAATTGIAGMWAFINLLKTALREISLPQRVFLFSILVHSLFNNSVFYIWIYFAIWLVLAIKPKEYKLS